MLVNIDKAYKFTFENRFSELNDIYLVTRIMTFKEVINDNVDLGNMLYERVNLTKADYENEVTKFLNDKIYKVVQPDRDEILYLPNSILQYAPDPNVKRYMKLVVSLDLGVFDNVETLEHVARIMQEHISGSTGILKTPELDSYGYKWLSEEDYLVQESKRDESLKTVTNFFTACNTLQKERDRLITKLAAYEEIIKTLSNP